MGSQIKTKTFVSQVYVLFVQYGPGPPLDNTVVKSEGTRQIPQLKPNDDLKVRLKMREAADCDDSDD